MSKELKVKDMNATLIYVAVDALKPNPYRDMKMFPIDGSKVESLKESIQQTGFWPSILVRPKNNMVAGKEITAKELEMLLKKGDIDGIEWEKAFGHHRQAACEALGFEKIPVIPQVISDEQMLQMMANENKEGFGSNINSMMETVRQVKQKLEESIADYDDYESYKADMGKDAFFKTAKAFINAQKQGVGFRTIRRFLGETWSDRDVRSPLTVLSAIDDGLFHQEDIVNVPSIGLLEGIASLARIIYEGYTPQKKDADFIPAPDWPVYYKDRCVEEIIRRCSVNPEEGKVHATVTVAGLDKARQALLKNGVNPASYLRSGKGKTPFDVYKAMKEEFLVPDKELEENLATIDGFSEMDDFADWAGLPEVCEKLRKAAEAMAKGEDADSEGDDIDLEGADPLSNAVEDMEAEISESPFDLGGGADSILQSFNSIAATMAQTATKALESDDFTVDAAGVEELLNVVECCGKLLLDIGAKDELVSVFRKLK